MPATQAETEAGSNHSSLSISRRCTWSGIGSALVADDPDEVVRTYQQMEERTQLRPEQNTRHTRLLDTFPELPGP